MSMKAETFNELKSGFISPTGEFFQVESFEHISAAEKIYNDLHGTNLHALSLNDVEYLLCKEGWCVIHFMTFMEHGYMFNFYRHLTTEQKRVIRPVVEKSTERIIERSMIKLRQEFEY